MIETACAFTGHRPKSFPWKYNETAPDCVLLKEVLAECHCRQPTRKKNVLPGSGSVLTYSPCEQLTYLMFIRSLDEKELEAEEFENTSGEAMPKIFPQSLLYSCPT